MGNLLRLLSRDETPKYDVFLDFESESILISNLISLLITKSLLINWLDARPTDTEKEVYILVECVLLEANDILHELQQYKGLGTEIREVFNYLYLVFI
jgi:hypothetical protein